MVALPNEHFMDVGLACKEWELEAGKFADAELTLTFPAVKRRLQSQGGLETLLQDVFADAASFGRSDNCQLMGKVIEEYLKENIGKIGAGGILGRMGLGKRCLI